MSTIKLKPITNRLVPGGDRLAQGDNWRADKPTSGARGYGQAWRVARAAFLLINPLCGMCRERGLVTSANVLDHVEPHRGNQLLFWDQSNWQALCTPCHASRKQRLEHGGR